MDKFWTTLRPLRKVGKLRGVIEIPTFSEPSGFPIGCLEVGYSTANTERVLAGNLISNANCTVECWLKIPYQKSGTTTRILEWLSGAAVTAWNMEVDGSGNLTVAATSTTPTTYTISTPVPIGEWFHVAWGWDTTDFMGTYILINGVYMIGAAIPAVDLRATAPMYLYLGSNNGSGSYPFSIAHLRYWTDSRTSTEISASMRRPIGINSTNLGAYWKFGEAVGSLTAVDSCADAYNFTSLQSNFVFNPLDGIELHLGVEFAAGEFAIDTSGRNFSFKYPIVKPYATVNFTPVIRWVDTDGTVHRYALWAATIDYTPVIPLYSGQVIPDGATLEIFNVDGEETVDLTGAIEVLTSILHVVTSPFDVTPTADATLAINTAIGAPFPLVFPFDFDTVLTFS